MSSAKTVNDMDKIAKIRQEIEKERKILEDTRRGCGLTEYGCGRLDAFRFIDSIINSPQVDLEVEIEKYYYDNFAFISSAHTPTKDIVSDIATHFYELGQRRVAEMYDEVEYSRQRAEEEMSDKTLVEAAEEYGRKEYSHAIHFWDEGLSKKKPEVMKEDFVDSFKAGAKWMAGQGVSWEDKMTYYDGFLLYGKDERAFTMEGNFNEGDKVIVQIRKKEESK